MPEVHNADQLLIRYYGNKSPEEISDLTGIGPLDVAKRTEEILGRRDYLGEAVKVKTLLARMEAAAADLESRLPDSTDKNAAAIGNSIGGLLGRSLGELRKLREETKADASEVEASYALRMVKIIERAYDRQLGALAERYPKVSQDDLKSEFQDTILEIAREIDSE